ncbi:MAG: hypothetical protein MJK14_20160 [Rivularia sp. ALOHA_DT_140]|nr:hypothetical protein [Rivularia sp. ALOHA_DT_140]
MWRYRFIRFIVITLCSVFVILGINVEVGTAQFPFNSGIQAPLLNINIRDLENKVVAGSVYLDGKRLFSIAAPRASLNERLQNIHDNLDAITKAYLRKPGKELDIDIRTENGLPVIYVNEKYLLTVTAEDAKLRGFNPITSARNIKQELLEGLQSAKYERTTEFTIEQAKTAASVLAIMILMSGGFYYYFRPQNKNEKEIILTPSQKAYRPI